MTFDERLTSIRDRMSDRALDLILAVHDGAHFIETPNPVTVLSGFKSLGPAICLLDRNTNRDFPVTLIVSPAFDGERARTACPDAQVASSHDVVATLRRLLPKSPPPKIGTAGLAVAPSGLATRIMALVPDAVLADDVVFDAAARKTDDEIAWAREATRLAELNYQHLLAIARPGMSEDELAVE